MKFMVLVKANADSEAGVMPSESELVEMGKFNEELVKAGILLAAEGLQASSKGARIAIAPDGRRTVTDGPFTETKELIAGFWMIQVKSKQEAIEWFLRCPIDVEIRQVFDAADFEPVIQTEEGRAVLAAEEEFRKRTGT
ncbi:MAG TPA: YciI family protein [Solirubrobacterales bacterium]|nr:YciI family protein [Solirubrobacterales bacterium]